MNPICADASPLALFTQKCIASIRTETHKSTTTLQGDIYTVCTRFRTPQTVLGGRTAVYMTSLCADLNSISMVHIFFKFENLKKKGKKRGAYISHKSIDMLQGQINIICTVFRTPHTILGRGIEA